MKKLTSILVVFVYLALSVGIAKSTHFCMGRARQAALFSFESKKCFSAESEMENSCCKDTHELVKIENDQSAGQVIHTPSPAYILLGELFTAEPILVLQEPSQEFNADYNLPPPKVPIYKSIHSLIFYESAV